MKKGIIKNMLAIAALGLPLTLGTQVEAHASVRWVNYSNNWYAINQNNHFVSGWVKDGSTWYYLQPWINIMKTGWLNWNNNWYYLQPSGAMKTGWLKEKNQWYFLTSSGAMSKGWIKEKDSWYYMASGGQMQSGWKKLNNKWYYLGGANDGKMKTGWFQVNKKWYYAGNANDGVMRTGWLKDNGKWYYLGAENDGAMKTGWVQVKGNRYFLTAGGQMQSGWIKDKENWYYLGAENDGVMKTGWVKVKEDWYYLEKSGAMKQGFFEEKGNLYYLKEDGKMATGLTFVGKEQFYFNKDGIAQRDAWVEERYYGRDGKYDATKPYVEDQFETIEYAESFHIEKVTEYPTQSAPKIKEVKVVDVPAFSFRNYLKSIIKVTGEAHVHDWQEAFKMVQVLEKGHWDEKAVIKEAWVEEYEVEEEYNYQTCNYCHEDLTSMYNNVEEKEANITRHMKAHIFDDLGFAPGWSGQYGMRKVKKQIQHPATYGRKWIVDVAAHKEQVSDGYRCSCEKHITKEELKSYTTYQTVEKEMEYATESHIDKNGVKVIDKKEKKMVVVGAYSLTTDDFVGALTKEEVEQLKVGATSSTQNN